jgi:hypothetical protein
VRFVVTERIHAPREAVFDVISDPRLRTRWQSSLVSVHMETEGPPRLGMRWHEHTRGGLRFELEINEFERPSRWAEVAHGRFADARLGVGLRVGSTPDTTSLMLTVEVELAGPSRLVAPAVRAVLPVALRADLRRVEALARAIRPAAS